ncbi:MAG: NADH-quinone oxidoreductase subunit C [Vicinamibacterales bacterium]
MDATHLEEAIRASLPGVALEFVPSIDLHTTLFVEPNDLIITLQTLRDRADLKFELLSELTAADYWPREPRFELIYILVSIEHSMRVRLKVRVRGTDPHVATATTLWPAANWLEREVWDLFGIAFDGHPDPRRLLMPEDWEGFPARKDYPVQIITKPEAGSPLQMTPEEFQANLLKDRLARE